jgi:hypothetical protein
MITAPSKILLPILNCLYFGHVSRGFRRPRRLGRSVLIYNPRGKQVVKTGFGRNEFVGKGGSCATKDGFEGKLGGQSVRLQNPSQVKSRGKYLMRPNQCLSTMKYEHFREDIDY